jgi:hypothetical protein
VRTHEQIHAEQGAGQRASRRDGLVEPLGRQITGGNEAVPARVGDGGRQCGSGRPTRHGGLDDWQLARHAHVLKSRSSTTVERVGEVPYPTRTPKERPAEHLSVASPPPRSSRSPMPVERSGVNRFGRFECW